MWLGRVSRIQKLLAQKKLVGREQRVLVLLRILSFLQLERVRWEVQMTRKSRVGLVQVVVGEVLELKQ